MLKNWRKYFTLDWDRHLGLGKIILSLKYSTVKLFCSDFDNNFFSICFRRFWEKKNPNKNIIFFCVNFFCLLKYTFSSLYHLFLSFNFWGLWLRENYEKISSVVMCHISHAFFLQLNTSNILFSSKKNLTLTY